MRMDFEYTPYIESRESQLEYNFIVHFILVRAGNMHLELSLHLSQPP